MSLCFSKQPEMFLKMFLLLVLLLPISKFANVIKS